MTIKIELSDVVADAMGFCSCQYCGGRKAEGERRFNAALEAMVEEGTAKVAVGYGVAPDSHWVAEVGLPDGEHTFSALIIRLSSDAGTGDKPWPSRK